MQKKIILAQEALNKNPNFDLPLGHRQNIWNELGPQSSKMTPAHKHRTNLAILTAEHVLPIWTEEKPNDDTLKQILELASKVRDGEIKVSVAEKKFDDYWEWLSKITLTAKSASIFVAYAVVKALQTAIQDEIYDPEDINLETLDSKFIEDNDTSFFAAGAYANGLTWRISLPLSPDVNKRKEFWEWWLKQVIEILTKK